MLLAIMSDSHDNWINLEKAVSIANERGCDHLLHAGDLISPPMIQYLDKFAGPVTFVWGNNESEKMGITRMLDANDHIELAGGFFEGELGGKKIFMNHYPKFAEHAAASGEYDLVIHGHTHEYREESIGTTLLLNPGEVMGLNGDATFVVYNTETGDVEKVVIG